MNPSRWTIGQDISTVLICTVGVRVRSLLGVAAEGLPQE